MCFGDEFWCCCQSVAMVASLCVAKPTQKAFVRASAKFLNANKNMQHVCGLRPLPSLGTPLSAVAPTHRPCVNQPPPWQQICSWHGPRRAGSWQRGRWWSLAAWPRPPPPLADRVHDLQAPWFPWTASSWPPLVSQQRTDATKAEWSAKEKRGLLKVLIPHELWPTLCPTTKPNVLGQHNVESNCEVEENVALFSIFFCVFGPSYSDIPNIQTQCGQK